MGLYDAFKDAISVAQKADNVELYRQLLDLSAQALDLQAEVARLTEENKKLKEELTTKSNVVRHKGAYITLENDEKEIPYCAICYGTHGQFLQLLDYDETHYFCYNCKKYIDKKID
jgi:hypothetical protein